MSQAIPADLLHQDVQAWNAWRKANPGIVPDLGRAGLAKADLRGADLSHARLRGADLRMANLKKANLAFSDLTRAELGYAKLVRADLRAAKLKNAQAEDADLTAANLTAADLKDAQLHGAVLTDAHLHDARLKGADFSGAVLRGAQVHGVRYDRGDSWGILNRTGFHPARVRHHLTDLVLGTTMRFRGADASGCVGSRTFTQFAQDQDYLEELWSRRSLKPAVFLWWLFADNGRSVGRWAAWSFIFVLCFTGMLYSLGDDHFVISNLDHSFFTYFYFSVVTFTTLGFGDVLPVTHVACTVVLTEVVVGYVMLGGLISIFSTRLARRSG